MRIPCSNTPTHMRSVSSSTSCRYAKRGKRSEEIPLVDHHRDRRAVGADAAKAARTSAESACDRVGGVDRVRYAVEDPVEAVAHQLVDHRFLRVEVVIEASRQDPGGIGDLPHGGGREALARRTARLRSRGSPPAVRSRLGRGLAAAPARSSATNLAHAWSALLEWVVRSAGTGRLRAEEGTTMRRRVQGVRRRRPRDLPARPLAAVPRQEVPRPRRPQAGRRASTTTTRSPSTAAGPSTPRRSTASSRRPSTGPPTT